MKKILLFLSLMLCFVGLKAQDGKGIKFFKGTFAEAQALAAKENKLLFVDFYAVWCGPCKKMEKYVFTDEKVGTYFAKHFVSLKIDAEKPEHVELAKKYKVESFPTLGFIRPDGQAVAITTGYLDVEELIKEARTATGDIMSFDKLYEVYKKDKNNLSLQQELLQQAPSFLSAQDGINAEKWAVRLRKLYQGYIKAKMGPDLINKTDYLIISSLGEDGDELSEQILDFMNKNLSTWIDAVGQPAAYYIIEKNDAKMEALAKEGKTRYLEYLEKVKGEYKDAYAVLPLKKVSPYDKAEKYYNALLQVYKNKDVALYLRLMNEYFSMLGEDASATDYGKAAQDLYYAAGSHLDADAHKQAIKWLEIGLNAQMDIMERLNFITMMGDSHKALKQYDLAQQKYNQAYAESLQLENMEMAQQMVQYKLKQKLTELELLRK